MTELKKTEYKTIEIAEDDEDGYGMVIGNIVMDGDKMLYAEIVGGTMCNHGELVNARAFLDEVEDAMTTNTSNVYNAETTPIINEECVECCKVVDIAAKLQEELEDTEIKLAGCRRLIDDRDRTIRELSAMVEAKTKANQNIINEKNIIIEEYKEAIRVERIDRAAEKKMINRKFCEDLRKLNATIEEYKEAIQLERIDHITTLKTVNQYHHTKIKALKDSNIDDLKELYDFHEGELEWFKDVISACESGIDECEKIGRHNINVLKKIINGLEAELSTCKEDSAVLTKIVDIANAWGKARDALQTHRDAMHKIFDLVDDYPNTFEDSIDSGDNTSYTVEMGIRCE